MLDLFQHKNGSVISSSHQSLPPHRPPPAHHPTCRLLLLSAIAQLPLGAQPDTPLPLTTLASAATLIQLKPCHTPNPPPTPPAGNPRG
jgi:hypothetical protein